MSSSTLTRPQKEAVGLLAIGTFLEYFDLMLYIHMAVILNKLFFPQTDQFTAQLLGAFSIGSTFVLRPIGGYIIGRLGDSIGRKNTIIITTFIMALCSFSMATIPTYDEIGIMASIMMIVCRALQGFSSMGEKLGAELYISEMLKQPHSYIYNSVIQMQTDVGGLFALVVAFCSISYAFNWRIAFYMGSMIALVGMAARTKLRGTPEYIDYKRRLRNKNIEVDISEDQFNAKAALSYFVFKVFTCTSFYVSYVYLIDIFYTVTECDILYIVIHNAQLTILNLVGVCIIMVLYKKYHPIVLANSYILLVVASCFILPYCVSNISNIIFLFIAQVATFIPSLCMTGIQVSCFKHINITRRFTILGTVGGLASMFVYALIPMSLVVLTKYFGAYAILFVYIPLIIAFFIASNYIKKLEIQAGTYNNYPYQNFPYPDTAIEEENYEYNVGAAYEAFKVACKYSTSLLNDLQRISTSEKRPLNMRLIEKAIIFAKKFHGNQMRKTGDVPFYSHPLQVARMTAQYYCKTDVIIAAILHDVVEDSDCTIPLLEQEFNGRIAEMVDRLTKRHYANDEDVIRSFEQTMNMLERLEDFESAFIKKMDRSHNLETIEGLKAIKQKKMAQETSNILVKLVSVIGDKLGFNGKIQIEDKISERCDAVLKSNEK